MLCSRVAGLAVKVRFIHGHRDLGTRELDAIPRAGDAVAVGGEADMIVWSVGWQLDGDDPAVWVMLERRRDYSRALYGRDDPAAEPRRG